jgi:hypothetical protein
MAICLSMLALAGCGDDTTGGGDDLSTVRDMSAADLAGADLAGADLAGLDLAAPVEDLAMGGDLAGLDLAGAIDLAKGGGPDLARGGSDGGGVGAPCKTACDCQPGLDCVGGACAVAVPAVYCCTDPNCPFAEHCQYPNGTMSFCQLLGDGGVTCAQLDCKQGGVAFCMSLGCTMCVQSGGKMACAP